MSWLKKAVGAIATGGLSLLAKPVKNAVDTVTGKKADKAGKDAANNLIAAQQEAAKRFEPYTQLGSFASGRLTDIMSGKLKPNLADIPGYSAGLDAGQEAIRREAAAQGAQGGGTLAALFGFGQRYAGEAFNNYMGTLQNMTQIGANAAAGVAGTDVAAGNARAAEVMGRAQRGSQLVGTVGGLAGMAFGGPAGGFIGGKLSGMFGGGGNGAEAYGEGAAAMSRSMALG